MCHYFKKLIQNLLGKFSWQALDVSINLVDLFIVISFIDSWLELENVLLFRLRLLDVILLLLWSLIDFVFLDDEFEFNKMCSNNGILLVLEVSCEKELCSCLAWETKADADLLLHSLFIEVFCWSFASSTLFSSSSSSSVNVDGGTGVEFFTTTNSGCSFIVAMVLDWERTRLKLLLLFEPDFFRVKFLLFFRLTFVNAEDKWWRLGFQIKNRILVICSKIFN